MRSTERKKKKSRLAVALFSLLEPVTPFTFTGVAKRLFLPLWKRPLCWGVWPLIIIITGIIYVQTGIAELHRLNLMDARVLAAEFQHEAGPNWLESSRQQAEMLGKYIDEMNNRHLAFIAKRLHPEYDFTKKLTSIKEILETITSDENNARGEMSALAKELIEFCDKVDERFSTSIIWYKVDSVHPDRVRDIKTAFTNSDATLVDFKKDVGELLQKPERLADKTERERIMAKARELCMTHRETWELSFLHRLGYDDAQSMLAFSKNMQEGHRQMTTLADKIREITENICDPNADLLDAYAASEKRRRDIILVMIEGDMEILCKAVHDALTESSS